MGTKKVQSVVIRMNDGSLLKVKHSEYRRKIHEATDKYRELLKKHKLIWKEETMFVRKEYIHDLENENSELKRTNSILSNQISRLEDEKKNLRIDIDCEHLENAEQHKKLKAIEEKLQNGTFGSYKSLLQFKNEIQEILKNEPSISGQTKNRWFKNVIN